MTLHDRSPALVLVGGGCATRAARADRCSGRTHGHPFPARSRARSQAAGARHAVDRRDAADRRGARPRRDPDAQPRDLRHDVDGARGPARHRGEPPPQLHRPRGVPTDRRDRAALHPHARRPVQRAGRDDRSADAGLLRGHHARSAVAQVEVASAPGAGGQGHRSAQPRLRRGRARGVGEVLPLLRRRAADHPAPEGQVHDRAGRRGTARGREHDRRGGGAGDHFHRARRRLRRHQRPPGQPQERARTRCPAPHRRGERWLRLAVPVSGLQMGLPARAGPLDQRLRSQVRARLSGDRLAHLQGDERSGRGPRLLRELPRQARRHVHAELLDRLGHGARPVLQLRPPGARRLSAPDGDDAGEHPGAFEADRRHR